MKVLLVGASGTIGQAVAEVLGARHDIIRAGRKNSDLTVDMTSPESIAAMYAKLGRVDAIVVTAGNVHFGELQHMTPEHFQVGLQDKLMGQINLTLMGLAHLADSGSVTLTSGVLNHDPIRLGSSAAMVNGAIDGFVTSAAIEMPRGIRINAVSPTVLTESMGVYAEYFRGFKSVAAEEVALSYQKSVEGAQTGMVYQVGYSLN